MTEFKPFIQSTIGEAADIAREHFGNVSQSVKPGDNNQVLTEADGAVGRHIIERIAAEYPDHNIIDEEAGVVDNGSRYTWVIDPIDGTSNFANGSPLYGILLGLLEDNTPIAGGIALPAFNEIYVASRGSGSFRNGSSIHVSNDAELLNSLVAYGIDGHQEAPGITHEETALLGKLVLAMRNLRSSNSVFDTAMAARGVYGASLNRTSKIWDNVAQQIVFEEAGGIYTDFFGQPIDYSNPMNRVDQNFTFCAASPELHKQLQAIITSN